MARALGVSIRELLDSMTQGRIGSALVERFKAPGLDVDIRQLTPRFLRSRRGVSRQCMLSPIHRGAPPTSPKTTLTFPSHDAVSYGPAAVNPESGFP